ncbi:MAG: sugar phosphate nucleotidyltransferase [Patescibacteria group bacterium]|nr:sugar phosphate nucleotidyltransferase [Patescibacteria group bacterium]
MDPNPPITQQEKIIVKKVIIPTAGLGTRFLPLSKVVPKEFWPLVDKPVLQYIIEEAAASGIKEIVFVVKPNKKIILNYFKEKIKSKKILRARYKNHFLSQLKRLENLSKKISFSTVIQQKSLGDGDAILKAEKLIKKEFCAVLFADDVVEAKIPCLLQLIKVFKKYKKPVIALYRVPKESFQFYGMVGVKKVGNRTYRITKIIEKPQVLESPSNLAIVGRSIITNEVFNYLKRIKFSERGEIRLTEAFVQMLKAGSEVYGYEFEGKWLECGNKLAYLKSNLYLSLKHPQFGKELKKYLKTI